MKRINSITIVLTISFLILGILLALQMKGDHSLRLISSDEQDDFLMLQEEVMALVRENRILVERNNQLSDYIRSLSEEISGEDTLMQQIIEDKSAAEAFAGLTDLSGQGLVITLDYGTDIPVKSGTLLLIVNELRAAGALAISVSNERIVALSEIRDVGTDNPRIIINGNSYSAYSKFYISAIFRPQDINRASQLLADITGQLISFGDISLNVYENVQIPRLSEYSITYRKMEQ